MKTISIFLLAACVLIATSCKTLSAENKAFTKPISIVIIGGGPAGLASAIEARKSATSVTIFEKREQYTRPQWLFLTDDSLKLLDQWNVTIPEMKVIQWGDNRSIGVVQIKCLEEGLEKTALALGIQKLNGTFKSLSPDQRCAIISFQDKDLSVPYDVLVGADGSHSQVSEALKIQRDYLGTAVGVAALISKPSQTSELSQPVKMGDFFLRRIKVPTATIIFMQGPFAPSKDQFKKLADQCGWHQEAELMENDATFIFTDIPVTLQRTKKFSCEEKSAILVGDAAATASFFQGKGANTALKTAKVAGLFFQKIKEQQDSAYQEFDQAMQETSDFLINDSLFLFTN